MILPLGMLMLHAEGLEFGPVDAGIECALDSKVTGAILDDGSFAGASEEEHQGGQKDPGQDEPEVEDNIQDGGDGQLVLHHPPIPQTRGKNWSFSSFTV